MQGRSLHIALCVEGETQPGVRARAAEEIIILKGEEGFATCR